MKADKQSQLAPSIKQNRWLNKVKYWVMKCIKGIVILTSFLLLSHLFSLLSTINGTEIPESYFSNGLPSIIGLFDSEFFMGLIFVITVTVCSYVIYLLWQLHEIAVHRSEKIKSHQANLVFSLSLCGLFINKGWWVLAVIIAFTNWISISNTLSSIIRNGLTTQNDSHKLKKLIDRQLVPNKNNIGE
ncbi:hypothetical protein BCU68_04285 [Vibrio sp. 10N.286.49.B3]|uniref:magnesium transporter n=1 Tax=Vibrio sp. 10N.286.49.B3 TaxID=1880855 RepID=UPI000CBD6001|nr:magnesium transporter [Vibrio sp. 10N.286.49.B3]PMH43212.1 hypothetical protein BCU68_04285 [Vibrio sp. 10N.286.49.B3]